MALGRRRPYTGKTAHAARRAADAESVDCSSACKAPPDERFPIKTKVHAQRDVEVRRARARPKAAIAKSVRSAAIAKSVRSAAYFKCSKRGTASLMRLSWMAMAR